MYGYHTPGLLAADTSQAEIAPHQAIGTHESGPEQEPLPPDLISEKQSSTSQTPSLEVRTNQRRYGHIFHNPTVEAIGLPPGDDSIPTTDPIESTEAFFPPLPPFHLRKRCGGA